MSNRVRKTDFRSIIRDFCGMDDDKDTWKESDLSEEEYIKKCKEISEQEKEDLLNAVLHSTELEAMLDYSHVKKTKIERLKLDRSDKDRNKLTMEHVNKTKRRGREIGD